MPVVYLIPSLLHEDGLQAIPTYIRDAVGTCQVFFVENERSARRFLKKISREIVIDDHEWYTIDKTEPEMLATFKLKMKEGKNVGIISEAGCPGVADPGQILVAAAHSVGADVKPLVGPNSILLALMASGMNGQQFRFAGYLPVEAKARTKAILDLEAQSRNNQSTQIFIETPYRNDQLLDALLKSLASTTQVCIAMDLTAKTEWIKTRSVQAWKKERPALHKRLVIFLLYAGT